MFHQKTNHLSFSIILLTFFFIGIVFYNEDVKSLTQFSFYKFQVPYNNIDHLVHEDIKLPPETCDIFDGNWVFDDLTRPLYKEDECEFLTDQVRCLRNGRQDSEYQKWRWQPKDCDLPKFSARLLVEKLKNKRLMFVGDSLNRNQWESMVCLVQSVVGPGSKSMFKTGSLSIFRIEWFNGIGWSSNGWTAGPVFNLDGTFIINIFFIIM